MFIKIPILAKIQSNRYLGKSAVCNWELRKYSRKKEKKKA
jgi:hypothetical protein